MGLEEVFIHFVNEVIGLALLSCVFYTPCSCLYSGGYDSCGDGGDEACDGGSYLDDIEDGGCFAGFVHGFDKIEEHVLVDTTRLQVWGVSSNKPSLFVFRPALGEDDGVGKTVGSWWSLKRWVIAEKF